MLRIHLIFLIASKSSSVLPVLLMITIRNRRRVLVIIFKLFQLKTTWQLEKPIWVLA